MVSLKLGHKPGFVAIALAMFLVALSFAPASALTVSGRAYVVYINIPAAGFVDQYFVDTGNLAPVGGDLEQSASSLVIPDLLQTAELGASSRGDDCHGDSEYFVSSGVFLPGDPAEIAFSSVHGHDDDRCCDSPHAPHAAGIDDLTFGGESITVTGAFDQQVTIPGVGTLTINETGHGHHGGGGGHDCRDDDDDLWVNALHLVLDSGGELIVGSANFHSDDHCCAVATKQSTWSSIKSLYLTK